MLKHDAGRHAEGASDLSASQSIAGWCLELSSSSAWYGVIYSQNRLSVQQKVDFKCLSWEQEGANALASIV